MLRASIGPFAQSHPLPILTFIRVNLVPSSPGMQTRLVLPDRTVRGTSATHNRKRRDQSSSSPRCCHGNSVGDIPVIDAGNQHSDNDWDRVRDSSGNSSDHLSSSPDTRYSICCDRKHGRRKAARLNRDQRLQHRRLRLPSVKSTSSHYVSRWSDDAFSDFFSDDSKSDAGSNAPDVLQQHTLPSVYPGLSRVPGLMSLLPEILDHSWGKFRHWKQSAQYIIPPDHRIQSHHQHSVLIESHDPSTSTTLITPVHGYYPLACPLSLSHHCVPLSSIPKLIRHLKADHREPIYCVICGSIFSTFRLRDRHVREQICEYKEHFDPDGVDDRRLAKIARRDDPSLDEERRWRMIWEICFPGDEAPSPWVTEGVGLEATMVRDWWAAEGRACLEGYLEGKGDWDREGINAAVAVTGLLLEGRALEGGFSG